MKLYFAGIERGVFVKSKYASQIYDALIQHGVQYGLTSYFYLKKDPSFLTREVRIPHIFLDSGAFSAYNSGASIKLEEYTEFVKAHQKSIDVFANLDVIGDAEATLDNQKAMEKEGLEPMPAFHMGEDWQFLKDYMDNGYKYIGLGGLVGKRAYTFRSAFLRKCFEIIPKKVKVHGFGMTSPRLLDIFPWYSADSINWIMGEMRGRLYIYDRGTIRNLRYHKKPQPMTGQRMAADKWNIIQWKKYADHLELRKPWGTGGI